MNITVSILLAVTFMVMLVIVALLVSPKTSQDKGVNINLPDNASLKIKQSDKGMQLNIEYTSWEDRPSDAELFPDIVNNTPPPEGSLDRTFWQMYANFDGLTADEREKVLGRLVEHGLLAPEAVEQFTLPDDEDANAMKSASAEPTEEAPEGGEQGDDDLKLDPEASGQGDENAFENHEFDS